MHLAATRWPGLRGGFLHVPYLPSQAALHDGAPSMALDEIVRGIEVVLTVAAARQGDIAAAEGMIS
jgi:pyroglutamyl-peptidase